jgi:dTDP-4-dehydrorhamnose reductase
MLGQAFVSTIVRAGANVLAPSHKELDITNEISVRKYIVKNRPNYIINCVAMTDVDGCESDPTRAHLINSDAVGFIASAAKKVRSKFIHISTDYVFDGTTTEPYKEADPVHPIQIYGQSKLSGEAKALDDGGSVFRVQWLFGQGKNNFVDWVAKSIMDKKKIPIAEGQIGCPSSTLFVANLVTVCINSCGREIYHVAHDNSATRLDVARYIAEYFKKNGNDFLTPVAGAGFGKAPRPSNTALCADKLKKIMGVQTLGTWQADVLAYVSSRYNTWSL